MGFSIVHFYGNQQSRCGYCKGEQCSISDGMHAYSMMPQDYQDLIDRGWRRSGQYCYKPNNKTTCCPCYTIKCDALDFKPTKSHKKILKRFNRFLRDGKKDKCEESTNGATATRNEDGAGAGAAGDINDEPREPSGPLPDVDFTAVAEANPKLYAAAMQTNEHFDDNETEQRAEHTATETSSMANEAKQSLAHSADSVTKSLDGCKPPCKKAKQMRLERRQTKLAAKGLSADDVFANKPKLQNEEKTLHDYFNESNAGDKHKLKIVLVPAKKLTVKDEPYKLYRKYQTFIHKDDPNRLTPNNLQRFLYKTPLQYTKTHDGPAMGYGSFHQQYWLDNKLIAVAVIDILPYCVSSVYFFYDPDYSFLSLGTYGSLREIQLVRDLAESVPALKYYYMGFYIHSCPKMRYKGKLSPSHLLCPETYTWQLLTDEIRHKLDAQKYQRLNAEANARDADEFTAADLNDVKMLLGHQTTIVTYRQFIQSFNIKFIDNMLDIIRSRLYKELTDSSDDREEVITYGKLVGRNCAHRMLYLKVDE